MEDVVGKTLTDLQTPCFLVDLDILKRNCAAMRERSDKMGLTLRPHMKTHKTLEAGELMTNGTKRCITVSTVKEAEFFADGGFDDILYAYIFSHDKMERLKRLTERLELFHVLVDDVVGIELLENTPLKDDKKWNVFLKINCGNNRMGLDWKDSELPVIAQRLATSECMTFRGIYAHDGNNYLSRGARQVSGVADETAEKLLEVKTLLAKHEIECQTVATGSTPSCSKPGKLMSQLTEMHPGNYVFYDSQQCQIGSCKKDEVAGRVMTRVIGHYPSRNQMMVDSGFLALSHDHGLASGSYCMVERYRNLSLVKMTQEVGVIETADGTMIDYDKHPIGSVLYLLPYHSCATAALHPEYYIHSGDKIVSVWKPCRGW